MLKGLARRGIIGAAPSGPSGGWATSRYFRLDNFSFGGGAPEIMDIAFQDGNGVDIPVSSINTAAGNRTAALTESGNFTAIGSDNFMNFTYSSDRTPGRLRIKYREHDIDFIDTLNIHVSADSGFASLTQIGSVDSTNVMHPGALTDQQQVYWDLGVPVGIAMQPTTYVITV